jgi:hypothetical protein
MKLKTRTRKHKQTSKRTFLNTTIMELLDTLSALTKDDFAVISTFADIFDSCDVRLAHSSIPVRLVGWNGAMDTKSSTASPMMPW